MTDQGRAHIAARLTQAPTLDALLRVWEGVGDDYKRDPQTLALKYQIEKGFAK